MLRNKFKTNLLTRLVALNSLVILLVILLAGLTLKDYTCYIVNTENVTGSSLVETLNWFLLKVSILAFVIVGIVHYITAKKMIGPLKELSDAAREIQRGKSPEKLKISTSGELKELVESFNSMSESLRISAMKRDEMMKDIAHELRTPLTNMNGYLEGLKNEVIDGSPALFGSLHEESSRITRIVEHITDLNNWNEIEQFHQDRFQAISIKKLLDEIITAFDLKLTKQFTNISIELEEAEISGDKDGLKQVFTNILQNISDYNTGDSLSVSAEKGTEVVIIAFTHKGKFIDPIKKDMIFERFYRVDESRTTKSDGAGLGLAIASSIISAHQGSLDIITDGTTHSFLIKIPLIRD
ncbi:sensor histidine kinase [Rossellomorea aquimaris]|uniref:sensor histidine kinase n=2 Tax=Bacillaceae TaxID=186817 RepID=UPI0021CC507D|nr:HAMP domain-containing sensor histidine kinase [Rossellomorea vietnamensis]